MVSWRNILIFAAVMAALAVIALSVFFTDSNKEEKCNDLIIKIIPLDKNITFISEKEIADFLNSKVGKTKGKLQKDIKIDLIRQQIEKIPMVRQAKVFFAKNGNLEIEIFQRQPFYKIVNAATYYIDTERNIVEASIVMSADVPVASGSITKSFAVAELFDLVQFIQDDEFLSKMVEKIYVNAQKEIELVPAIGNQTIIVGKIEKIDGKYDFEQKLIRLKHFYSKGVLNKMGWETYSVIDLRYKKQVVCRK